VDALYGVAITVAGVRVAFVGKGGAGKSSIAGTFARLLAATGQPVLALDSDPMPGLAFSVGIANVDAGIPDEAVEDYDDDGRRRYRLRAGWCAFSAARQGTRGEMEQRPTARSLSTRCR
jgi:CO dehydrogenase maturation factor